MAEEAANLLKELPPPPREPSPSWHRRLTDIANSALEGRQGVEGGYYLADHDNEGKGMFSGHAFPNDPHQPPEPSPRPRAVFRSSAARKRHHSRSMPGQPDRVKRALPPIVQVRDIGPSRVLIVTEAVGRQRPAPHGRPGS